MVSQNTSSSFVPTVSDELADVLIKASTGIGLAIAFSGIVANVINVTVFVRMGFKDASNVSLFGLAVSDLLGCVMLLLYFVIMNPWFQELDLPFDPSQVQHLTVGGWHVIFSRVTGVVTAFITFERCLCVAMPMKVKRIVTPRRAVVVVVCCFVLTGACFSPAYYTTSLGWVFYPSLNKTLLALVFTDDRAEVDGVMYVFVGLLIPMSTFTFVVVCTAILVVSLHRKVKWRMKAKAKVKMKAETTSRGQDGEESSSKENKASTLVTMIAALFIGCYFPVVLISVGMVSDQEMSPAGKERNFFFVIFTFTFLLSGTNSALNIFMYYHKNTKYRAVFDRVFCACSGRKRAGEN